MITLYEGFPGSGKTYDAVRKVIANLLQGRRVLTNIDGMQNAVPAEAMKHLTGYDDKKFSELLTVLTQEQTKFSTPGIGINQKTGILVAGRLSIGIMFRI